MSAPSSDREEKADEKSEESFRVRIQTWDDSASENIVFTAVSSNHKMSFSSADTCCSCTT